ncbi:NAD(P)H-dependent oxidoreductase [Streptomyces sp. J2-1]|uniref:FMN-dependent NADH-azoreductase n=1 Tax=Streptomyces corallincola TaxID=2851888 RepID=UPI001C38FAB6|nr:NAD(P)H-dependent oxidoreductase [Streptomyces corallincola]MBV2356268.1 NAD(P)H-dependent oxidoreductase [Streptomyces corallincola]
MKLFRLDSSILPSMSASVELADIAEAEWKAAHPEGTVVRRSLGAEPLPAHAWAAATTGSFTPEDSRTPEQREALELAATLAAELQDADVVILGAPLYNYGVSQHFKTWVDLVIAGAGAATPVLKSTPTLLITALGGGYGPGTPREGWDHSTAYLERIVGDLWQAELTLVKRELTVAATTPEMESLRDLAASLHDTARDNAREAGRALAGN